MKKIRKEESEASKLKRSADRAKQGHDFHPPVPISEDHEDPNVSVTLKRTCNNCLQTQYLHVTKADDAAGFRGGRREWLPAKSCKAELLNEELEDWGIF